MYKMIPIYVYNITISRQFKCFLSSFFSVIDFDLSQGQPRGVKKSWFSLLCFGYISIWNAHILYVVKLLLYVCKSITFHRQKMFFLFQFRFIKSNQFNFRDFLCSMTLGSVEFACNDFSFKLYWNNHETNTNHSKMPMLGAMENFNCVVDKMWSS